MSTKPWPTIKQNVEASQSLPQPWPQWPSTVDCGHNAVAHSGIEYEIDGGEVVQLVPIGKTRSIQNLRPPWQPGTSANPKGRPRGSKHKITELARSIVAEDFAEHGKETLERVRAIDPVDYLQLVFKFVPRELILSTRARSLHRLWCID